MPRVHLVDALPYVFRAYFSLPPSMKAPDGRPINAVHGFASFLLKLLAEEEITHLAVAFDESLTTSFRNEMLPSYKQQRELPPAELEAQLHDCQDLARALGATVLSSARYEADDLIATLCRRVVPQDVGVVVVSSDKDLAQLVDARTSLYDFGKGERLGPAEVMTRLGVPPERVADLLGLMGDAVDNIPGVPGIGAKTATALVAAFGSLEDVLARVAEVDGLPLRGAKSVRAKLELHHELARLSKRVALLADDVEVGVTYADLALRPVDAVAVDALCSRLGWSGRRERLIARR
jgi:5'-3' exonuclease